MISPELERALKYYEPIHQEEIDEIEDSFDMFTYNAFEKDTRERAIVFYVDGGEVSIMKDGTNEADYLEQLEFMELLRVNK